MRTDLRAQLVALAGDYAFSRLEPHAPEWLAAAISKYDKRSPFDSICNSNTLNTMGDNGPDVIPSRPSRVLRNAGRASAARALSSSQPDLSEHVC